MSTKAMPLVEARDVRKHFGGVRALRGVNFSVYPSEMVALIGDNGEGKSTLVKILAGGFAATRKHTPPCRPVRLPVLTHEAAFTMGKSRHNGNASLVPRG